MTVPDVSGRRLFNVAWPLYERGFEVRISKDLRKAWDARFGKSVSGKELLEKILLNLVLGRGPRVEVDPPPGTQVRAGSTVVLMPFSRKRHRN